MTNPAPTNVIELLQAMISFNTVNSAVSGIPCAEAKLIAYLESLAKTWHLNTQRLPVPNQSDQLLITCQATSPTALWLLFDSHLDTVAVDGMTIDPFTGDIQGDQLYGRGACDTKGTGAAMLWAIKQYAALDQRPNNIALLFSIDEEIAMTGVQHFVSHDLPQLDWSPAAIIVGEPTEHTPVIAHNGCVRWQLITHGQAVHSSIPWEGHSAITDMVKALAAIDEQYIQPLDGQDDLTGRAACSINILQGGSAPNIIPDRCVAEIDRRVIPGEDPSAVLNDVDAILQNIAKENPKFKYEQVLQVSHPPLSEKGSEPALALVRNAMHQCNVRRPAVGAPFATHAGYFAQTGCPTLVFGPGSPYPAHTKDEWVSIKEIQQGTKVYQQMMTTDLP